MTSLQSFFTMFLFCFRLCSATSKKGKKNKSANKIAGADEKVKERKKRARENEVDGGRDCPVEEFTRPTVKKAKLLNYTQEFKKPRKG